ncbi:MAG: tRNA preQ1(34) S-adenosylmethionine ribosyltransferase-isomerase QueA [Thermodesulfobacteriota bacterium]
MQNEYDISSYDFELPQELIAQHPLRQRSSSRLLLLDKTSGETWDCSFSDLPGLLPKGALLVRNVSRVFPARLVGYKAHTKGRVEFLLTTPLALLKAQPHAAGWTQAQVEGLFRPAKGLAEGQRIEISSQLELEVLHKNGQGQMQARLLWQGDLLDLLHRQAELPLPPYIKRQAQGNDYERYQTVYSSQAKTGSVAAPTAGLHFDQAVMHRLQEQGFAWADINLYVGPGTFSPLRQQDIREHSMHAEYVEIEAQEAEKIEAARQEGRPVLAVGTTCVRALESVVRSWGRIKAFAGWSDLFIYPGFEFQVVNHILTNFHLPRSSLLLMVSAFAGRQNILSAYQQAVQKGYRFFSYGDCMLIL